MIEAKHGTALNIFSRLSFRLIGIHMSPYSLACVLVLFFQTGFALQLEEPNDFFEMQIRPLLASKCYSCHTNSPMAALRLDSRPTLLQGGNSGPAIVPGDPEASLLIHSVRHTNEKLQMPFGGEKLLDQEIEDLVAWVKMGAPWPETAGLTAAAHRQIGSEERNYWAFRPLAKASMPESGDQEWPQSPVDHFILARLDEKGLSPGSAASKRNLVRRATFDLLGLPPTPEEVEDFIQDPSPQALSKLVDRLLASPHYGERWGRHWLDVARYAEDDVRGVSQESYPNAFRYRDWVVEALNNDMPYDLFVKAQIAADLLEGENREELLPGLGFFGLGPWYYDITVPRQARADERHDRIDALTRGFLGLTVACARCHDHKFDPISTQDYYALAGVFSSSEYKEYPLVGEKVMAEYHEQEKKIGNLKSRIDDFVRTKSLELGEILARKSSRYLTAAWEVFQGEQRGEVMAGAMPAESSPGGPSGEGIAASTEATLREVVQTVAAETSLDAGILQGWVDYLESPQQDHPYLKAWYSLRESERGLNEAREVADQFQATLLSVIQEKNAVEERNRRVLEENKPPENAKMTSLPNGFSTYEDFCPGCNVVVESLERDRFMLWSDLFGKNHRRADGTWNHGGALYFEGKRLDRFLGEEWRSHLQSLRAELESLEKARPERYAYMHGLSEAGRPADLKLNIRGSPFKLGAPVPRRFLEVLSPGQPELFRQGSGRLQLAEAIADHPLTARVIVNRIWNHHFGRGLVSTPSNFGVMGERPSHPELLEYLASRLVENQWSLKSLHREIMLSAVYQLSSDSVETNSAVDSDNRLFWRANRRRLDVEALRDSLLFVAGNLDERLGGPSSELDLENRRRSLYGTVSRFKLNQLLTMFDFPAPGISSAGRNVTHVPLQKLFFLNSDLIMQQRRVLYDRLKAHAPVNQAAMIQRAYQLLFGRPAQKSEVKLAVGFLTDDRASRPPEPAPSWEQYLQVLLSSNEFLFVD